MRTPTALGRRSLTWHTGTGEHDGVPCPVCDGTGKVVEDIGGG